MGILEKNGFSICFLHYKNGAKYGCEKRRLTLKMKLCANCEEKERKRAKKSENATIIKCLWLARQS